MSDLIELETTVAGPLGTLAPGWYSAAVLAAYGVLPRSSTAENPGSGETATAEPVENAARPKVGKRKKS